MKAVSRGMVALSRSRRFVPIRLVASLCVAVACLSAVLLVQTGVSQGGPKRHAPQRPRCIPSVGTASQWATFGSGSWPGACWRPYAAPSPYNQPLPPPSQTPLARNSAGIVKFMLGLTWHGNRDFSDMPVSNDPSQDEPSQWDHPLYWAHYGDPSYTIKDVDYPCEVVKRETSCPKTVLIPNGAEHALGGDGHLAVVQPDGTEVDFWQVQNMNPISGGGTLTVSEYGALPINGSGCCGQATAAMQGLEAGEVRGQELQVGSINHALTIAVECSNGTHVYPAAGDGDSCPDTAYAPAVGQRFQLNMTDQQVDALNIPAYRKVILKAMIHYGFYIADVGGGPWDLFFEPALDYTSFGAPNPFVVYAKQAGLTTGSSYTFTFNGGVDWSKLQVVNVCYTAGTC